MFNVDIIYVCIFSNQYFIPSNLSWLAIGTNGSGTQVNECDIEAVTAANDDQQSLSNGAGHENDIEEEGSYVKLSYYNDIHLCEGITFRCSVVLTNWVYNTFLREWRIKIIDRLHRSSSSKVFYMILVHCIVAKLGILFLFCPPQLQMDHFLNALRVFLSTLCIPTLDIYQLLSL